VLHSYRRRRVPHRAPAHDLPEPGGHDRHDHRRDRREHELRPRGHRDRGMGDAELTKCPAFWCQKEMSGNVEHTGDIKYAAMDVHVFCRSCNKDVQDASHADHEGLEIFVTPARPAAAAEETPTPPTRPARKKK